MPCRWNWAPTSSMYFGEFRKQYDAQWSGMKPLPPGDVVEQRLLLLGRDPRGVGVDDQAVVLCRASRVQVVDLVGVGQLDAALLQHRLKLPETGPPADDGRCRRGTGA